MGDNKKKDFKETPKKNNKNSQDNNDQKKSQYDTREFEFSE